MLLYLYLHLVTDICTACSPTATSITAANACMTPNAAAAAACHAATSSTNAATFFLYLFHIVLQYPD